VNDIVEATGWMQANISTHAALLAAAGNLEREKDGQRVDYGMKEKPLNGVHPGIGVSKLCQQVFRFPCAMACIQKAIVPR